MENTLSGRTAMIDGSIEGVEGVARGLARCGGACGRPDILEAVAPPVRDSVVEALAQLTRAGFIVDPRRRPRALIAELQRGVAVAERPRSLPLRGVTGGIAQIEAGGLATLLALSYRTSGEWKPVASAGRLWPLVQHALLPSPGGFGLSWFDRDRPALVEVASAADAEVTRLFWQADVAAETIARRRAVVIVSADTSRVARKYGNRGALFAILEAGAVAQQIALSAGVRGSAVRTICGFDVDRTRALLHPSLDPLVLIVVEGGEQ